LTIFELDKVERISDAGHRQILRATPL